MHGLLKSFEYARNGAAAAWRTEMNFRIEIAAAAFVLGAAYFLNISWMETAVCLFAIGLVIVAELFNTAIEELSDIVQPDHHPKIATVKNVSAAAVLCASIVAVGVGCIVFIPYVIAFVP